MMRYQCTQCAGIVEPSFGEVKLKIKGLLVTLWGIVDRCDKCGEIYFKPNEYADYIREGDLVLAKHKLWKKVIMDIRLPLNKLKR